jgi:hypothetical protein
MIKLDAGAIGFVRKRQRDIHRWIFFVSVIQKKHFFAAQPSREKRIPKLPDGLAYPPDGKQMVNDWHLKLLRKKVADANLVRGIVRRRKFFCFA